MTGRRFSAFIQFLITVLAIYYHGLVCIVLEKLYSYPRDNIQCQSDVKEFTIYVEITEQDFFG